MSERDDDHDAQRDAELAAVLDEARAELHAHGTLDLAEWVARHPERAEDVLPLLQTLQDLGTVLGPAQDGPGTVNVPGTPTAGQPAPVDEPIPARVGRYQILGRLGAGGMGTVYKAHDPQLDRVVAVKVPRFDPRRDSTVAVQRFLREARAAAGIRHEHVCPIYDVGEQDGLPYVVMAHVAGESLAERLTRGRFDDAREAVELVRQVAEALEAVHAHGIIHRDLKPGNILLARGPDGLPSEAILTDFGLARPEQDSEHLTADGVLVGTPAYMAPEQIGGATQLGPATDVYSLGVVLYQLLTGRLPFEAGNMLALLHKIGHEEPSPPSQFRPDLDPALEAILREALARRPEDRYSSARRLRDALDGWLATTGDKVTDPVSLSPCHSVTLSPKTAGQRRRLLLVGVAAAVLVAGTVLCAQQIIIRITDKEGRTTEVTVPPGNKVEITQGGKVLASVPAEKASPARPPNVPAEKASQGLPSKRVNSLGMEFVLVKKGTFVMGGGGGQPGDRQVEIDHDFYLSVYEVTQEQWQTVTAINLSHFSRAGAGKEAVKTIADAELKRFPAENLSWNDTQIFLTALNVREKDARWVYRLPTEAEWEYACRGGPSANPFHQYTHDFYLANPTDQLLPGQANFTPEPVKGLQRSAKVGSSQPNALGLYDMHGNVWEWCHDTEVTNFGFGPSVRVLRGGSWDLDARGCRAASRSTLPPSTRGLNLGLRPALVLR